MNNKEMDFDLLENADMNTIEKIGADNMNIDKSARDRMLKNTMNKYQKEKKLLGNTPVITHEINDDADSVSGVENYDRKKITRIVSAVLLTAAALVIVGGSVFMIARHKPSGPDTPDPVTVATTTVSGTTMTSAKETSKTTATNTTENTTANTTVNTTVNTTEPSEIETTVVTTVITENPVSDITPYKNPHPERGNISAEELEAAKQRAMDRIMHESIGYTIDGKDELIETALWDIQTASFDINDDDIPELFVKARTLSTNITLMFIYDGSEYVQAKVNLHLWTGTPEVSYIITGTIKVCHRENLISLGAKEGHEYYQTVEVSADNTFTVLSEYNYSGYYKDGIMVIEKGEKNFSDNSAYETYINEYNSHEWRNLEYEFYAEKNDHAVKFENEHTFDSDQ